MQSELKEDVTAIEIRRLIHDKLGIGTELLTDRASFKDDLAVDSLDLIELQMEIEKQYSLNIPEEEAEKLKTVGSLISFVREKKR
ncbi:MAG TPA: acyl carrier protein [Puia sp.]|nr:acyl carrier protein [Puia sp.]